MKKIIDIPKEIKEDLHIMAIKDGLDLKNFIQKVLNEKVELYRKKMDKYNRTGGFSFDEVSNEIVWISDTAAKVIGRKDNIFNEPTDTLCLEYENGDKGLGDILNVNRVLREYPKRNIQADPKTLVGKIAILKNGNEVTLKSLHKGDRFTVVTYLHNVTCLAGSASIYDIESIVSK